MFLLLTPQPCAAPDAGEQGYPCSKRLTESNVQCLCPNCAERFKKVIYVVRDGRDVMYSYFKFRHGLGQNLRLTFSNFLEAKRHHYPGPKWHEHVDAWLNRAKNGHVEMLLVRYEDLLVDAKAELERMAAFIGIDASPGGLEWATQVSTADAMRTIEAKKGAGFFEKKYSGVKERRGKSGAKLCTHIRLRVLPARPVYSPSECVVWRAHPRRAYEL